VKYDPRDLSRVFVRRPSGAFVEARYSDLTLPSITLLVRAAVAQRAIVKGATKRGRPGRRTGAGLANAADSDGLGSLRGVDSRIPVASVEDLE